MGQIDDLIEALIEERNIKQHRYECYIAGVWPTDRKWKAIDEEVKLTQVMPKPMNKGLDFETVMIFTATINELDDAIKALGESIREE